MYDLVYAKSEADQDIQRRTKESLSTFQESRFTSVKISRICSIAFGGLPHNFTVQVQWKFHIVYNMEWLGSCKNTPTWRFLKTEFL